jgi:hypothetical protein
MLRLAIPSVLMGCTPVTATVFPPEKRSPSSDLSSNVDDSDGETVDIGEGVTEGGPGPEDPPGDQNPPGGDNDEDQDSDTPTEPGAPAEWTVMVYLAADNNLEDAALTDLNEMEQAGSTDRVNILVELDRAHGYSEADGDWTDAKRYRVEADGDWDHINTPPAVELGEVDSGAPETFIEFIRWGVENYPAEKYAFIIWNHGWSWSMAPSGPRKGIASDDHSGSDLTVAGGEYEAVLSAAKDIMGKKFALLGMDACLMASWEIARVSAPYADYYVASQATESFDGWAFHTAFSDLVADPEMDANELGTVIARRFHETEDSTLSVTNLQDLAAMDGAIDYFAQAVMDDDDPRGEVRRQARRSQNFDGDPNDRDMGDFFDRMFGATDNPDILSAADGMLAELDETIVANFTWGEWVSDATGLSIYLPTNGPDSLYLEGSWTELTSWDEMLSSIDN